jgi:hypothetical protein
MLEYIDLRRDQIRITSKNEDGESVLNNIIDFQKRTETNMAKNMMDGKY